MILIYQIIYTIIVIVSSPFILFLAVLGNNRIKERLALSLPKDLHENRRIWIHALSVGEVISAIPLIAQISILYPYKEIVFTVTTTKGIDLARKEIGDRVKIIPMPLDFWWSIQRIVRHINPSFFILVETDIWPALITHLSNKNIKCFLVNGRISPRTYKSYERFSFLIKPVLNRFTLCMMQSELDRKRLLAIGAEQAKIITTGNIKFDRDWFPMHKEERDTLLKKLSLDPEDVIWVAGSIHKDEDQMILNVFSRLVPEFPGLRLILAPRNIEESDNILKTVKDMGIESVLKTNLKDNRAPYKVLVLNTIGELGRIYGIGKISFVGGSLVPLGGHNILEPAGFGCPVLFGPHTHNFVLMSELLLAEKGGFQVVNEDEVYAFVKMLLENSDLCGITGRNAKKFADKHRGALKEVLNRIGEHVDKI
ncbi:MAG: 3-deoxy-D-manno-octulosonic acid transferase [Pseudomonadota bacterium]|nr:3-deoxy-D-manno-octulosonic acid transferase [Pseudomonadota bacterium]MBU1570423.1 3-deoxy-D-manno-octulosonic acid transferase [Pseudomonadota bacterium]